MFKIQNLDDFEHILSLRPFCERIVKETRKSLFVKTMNDKRWCRYFK